MWHTLLWARLSAQPVSLQQVKKHERRLAPMYHCTAVLQASGISLRALQDVVASLPDKAADIYTVVRTVIKPATQLAACRWGAQLGRDSPLAVFKSRSCGESSENLP